MNPRDHTYSGRVHVDVKLLKQVDRHIADPHTVAVAQVHATLAVADALADIHAALADRPRAHTTPPSEPEGVADPDARAASRRPVTHPPE